MTRHLASMLVLALVLAACGSSGEPTGFDQQPVPIGPELAAALDMGAADTLPTVERNFLEGCVLAETPRITGTADLAGVCQCTYDDLKTFYVDSVENDSDTTADTDVGAEAYKLYKALDEELRKDDSIIPANIQVIIDRCST